VNRRNWHFGGRFGTDEVTPVLNAVITSSVLDPLSWILCPGSSVLDPLSWILCPGSSVLDPQKYQFRLAHNFVTHNF
jgi:hypothetical protein